jgi:hypothetical protein
MCAVSRACNDDELFTALRDALGARQAVPEEFVEAAKSAFTWHGIDAELAQLTYDSTRSPEPAATRSEAASVRALTFTSARLSIELEVTGDSLLGQVVPAQQATVDVQNQAGDSRSLSSDEIGCFAVQPLPSGPFRLRCQAAGGIDVVTGWITL